MPIKGILFDKDGTLTDFHATWVPAYRAAARQVANAVERPTEVEGLLAKGGYDRASGRCQPWSPLACGSTTEIARVWADELDLGLGRVVDILENAFSDYAVENAVPVADLREVFFDLKHRELILGIATMDSEALAHKLLDRFELSNFFSFVCGYDSGFGQKPSSGMVHAFCEAVALSPQEIAVVGDTPHDLNMARNARAGLCVGVLSGASTRSSLENLADFVLPHIGDLTNLLGHGN